jgi:hypothetical protein
MAARSWTFGIGWIIERLYAEWDVGLKRLSY